jgi:TfoX/Sxy family transcriptional regulator of competence genes
MVWRKSPSELIVRFHAVLPNDPAVERRQMFGYPCAFVNGHMFTGLHQENMIVRLNDADRARLLNLPGSGIFEPMPGRPMREYGIVPPAVIADDRAVAKWLKLGLDYLKSIPPKQKKAKKTKPAAAKAAGRARAGRSAAKKR